MAEGQRNFGESLSLSRERYNQRREYNGYTPRTAFQSVPAHGRSAEVPYWLFTIGQAEHYATVLSLGMPPVEMPLLSNTLQLGLQYCKLIFFRTLSQSFKPPLRRTATLGCNFVELGRAAVAAINMNTASFLRYIVDVASASVLLATRMISRTSSREAARIVRDPVFNLRIERRISFASNIDKVSGYRRHTRFSRGPCWANGTATER
ncbi:hypothetical protein ALC56_05211 [Trachymyrmex septentrionalis]|uniref:Uncharacterized protein n=1 Tax=Trachymyrmex septentrionalis TaxID=34720 RepID=A0A195FIS0_9HYME|nr:hypothetical protein ALC56_05211 [Trachymyrmex septentrionalis]